MKRRAESLTPRPRIGEHGPTALTTTWSVSARSTFSAMSTNDAAKESNLPTRGCPVFPNLEDWMGNQARAAPAGSYVHSFPDPTRGREDGWETLFE